MWILVSFPDPERAPASARLGSGNETSGFSAALPAEVPVGGTRLQLFVSG